MDKLVVLSILLLSACGGSALRTHASAAEAVRTINDTTVEIVEETCETRAMAAAEDHTVHVDVARDNAATVLETCGRIATAQHAVAASHGLWVTFLLHSIAEDDFNETVALGYALGALQLYKTVVALAVEFDLELPDPPDVLLQLLGD